MGLAMPYRLWPGWGSLAARARRVISVTVLRLLGGR
jgi:hypothetical protein